MTMEPIQARPEKPEDRSEEEQRNQHIRVKNRRKTYLDKNPDYFSASLELAGPPQMPPHGIATIPLSPPLTSLSPPKLTFPTPQTHYSTTA